MIALFLSKRILFLIVLVIILVLAVLAILGFYSRNKPVICSCGPDLMIALEKPPVCHHQVWELQFHLQEMGYYHGLLDSVYDREVQQCLIAYQKDKDVTADGILDGGVWASISEDYYGSQVATMSEEEEPRGEVTLEVNTYTRTLTVYVDGRKYKTFPVAVGKAKTRTPVGEWAIIRKSSGWGGGFGTRWMELNVPWGIYGIHGTNKPYSIGRAASAGCIRMHNRDVEKLYRWVKIGTRVKVIGDPIKAKITHTLRPGHTGKDVLTFQRELKAWGFEPGYTDGRYGTDTERAVIRMETLYGLQVDGEAEEELAKLLGL